MLKKIFKSKIFKIALLILVLGIFIFLHFIGPRLIVGKRHSDKSYEPITSFQLDVDTLWITSKDGFKQEALWCNSNIDTIISTVLFVHGIGSRKDYYLAKAEELANQGIQTLLIDLRCHGNSEGDYITYGYYETEDISMFMDLILKEKEIDALGIWGQSLGGAISLQMLAKEDRIDFGIIESTYCTFDEVVHDYSKLMMGVPLGFLNDYVIWRAQSIANFDKAKVHPEEACAQIQQPVLLVHGTEDDRISIEYGKRNFKALASKHKTFIEVPGANHINVWEIAGEEYRQQTVNFITKGWFLGKNHDI